MDNRAWLRGDPAALETVSTLDRHGKPLVTLVNTRTGLVRNEPIPNDEELARFYSNDYRLEYKGAKLPRKRQALRNFRRAAEFVRANADILSKARRVLDIGAGSGEFLYTMQQMGKEARGIEPNGAYSQFCRDAYGLDVRTAHLALELFEAGGYDFIRLSHVLEHLNDPVRYLAMIAEWLAPDGTFYVEVPDIEQYCRTKSRGNIFHYGHIYNFNPWTLRAVARMAGLQEIETKASGTTGLFLRRSQALAPENFIDEANGARVLAALRRHMETGPSIGTGEKWAARISARVDEFFSTLGAKSFRDIGDRVIRTIAS